MRVNSAHKIVGTKNPPPSISWCNSFIKDTPEIKQLMDIFKEDNEKVSIEVSDIVPVTKTEISDANRMFEAVVSGLADEETVTEMRKLLKSLMKRDPIEPIKISTSTENRPTCDKNFDAEMFEDFDDSSEVAEEDVFVTQEQEAINNLISKNNNIIVDAYEFDE